MKEELSELTGKIENVTNKKNDLKTKKETYINAKGGFINSFGMMSVVIIYVSLLAFFTLDLLPSHISGFLALLLNTISIVLFVFAILNSKNNIKVLKTLNLKTLNLEIKKCDKELEKYNKKYNEIIETAILGDNF